MRQKLTDGYGGRLRKARERGPRPMSIRQLGREMEERYPDMRGATYGGVRLYLTGEVTNPRVELLRAIADVLGVRADWLAFDDGPMTEAEEAARRAEPDPPRDWPRETLEGGLREGFGDGTDWLLGRTADGRHRGARAVLIARTWRVLAFSPVGQALQGDAEKATADPAPNGEGGLYRISRAIGRTLRAPLDELGIDPARLDDDSFDDYVMAACATLRSLAAAPILEEERNAEGT